MTISRTLPLACAALLLLLPARSAHTAFGEAAAGVELEAVEKLTPDLTAAPVSFRVRESADPFAAAGSGELAGVTAWQIQVFDQGGRKVSFMQGRGRPPAGGIPWAGLSAGGEPLRDGFYKAKFVWQGADKRPRATEAASVSLSTPPELRKLSLSKLRVAYTADGLSLTFAEGLLFRPGESLIKEEALPALLEISEFLKSCPRNRVLVRGHSDASGSLQRNLALSGERAARFCRFLADHGIAAARLAYAGLGPSRPLASDDTEEGRARNRRVEVVVLKRTL